ncbi:MAG: myxococcus cysteine-rich repeat containing protein [Myxococcota bacterium]
MSSIPALTASGLLLLAGCGGPQGRGETPPTERSETDLCEPGSNPTMDDRPLWGQVTASNGVPDYVNPSTNINVGQSIRLFASLLQVVTNRMDDLGEAARSECICEGNPYAECVEENTCVDALQGKLNEFGANVNLPDPEAITLNAFEAVGIPKNECSEYCAALAENALCDATGTMLGWRKNDLLVGLGGVALKALTHIEWLDGFWDVVRSDAWQDQIQANQNAVNSLNNAADGVDGVLGKVDQFTEGFHIGGYSEERPDLWYCVPRAGGNVYAPLFNLLDGKISVGSRWRSGLAAKKIRAQFGWTTPVVQAFGLEIPLGLNLNLNTQIDAFKLFHRDKLFGLDVSGVALDVSSVASVAEHDALNVMEGDTWLPLLADIAGPDGQLAITDLFYDGYYPVNYTTQGGDALQWPRTEDDTTPEDVSTAVVGAGINFRHDFGDLLEPEDGSDTNPIEGTQELLAKIKTKKVSVSFGIRPYAKLGLAIELYNEASRLLDQVRQKINENLPMGVTPLGAGDLTRDDEAWMQAPDVSRDLGLEATVSPELGVQIGGEVSIPLVVVRANAGLGVRASITPGFAGDTIDINRAIADGMDDLGPTDGECVPEVPMREVCSCSNVGLEGSTHDYHCNLSATAAIDDLANGVAPQAKKADSLSCTAYGSCITKTGRTEDARESTCDGTFVPYVHIFNTVPDLSNPDAIEWTGDCHPLINGFDPEDAADIIEGLRANPDDHAIFTYAASTIRLIAMLTGFFDVRIELQAPFKIFGKRPKIRLRLHEDFSTDLGSTANVNFVKGLEADYESACNAPAEFTIHESESNFVLEHDVEGTDYQTWCFDTVEDDYTYEDVPPQTGDTLAQTINGLTQLGEVGLENLWSGNELCVGGVPVLEAMQDTDYLTGLACEVEGQVVDCGDMSAIAMAGGCATPNSIIATFCASGNCTMQGGQVVLSSMPDTIPSNMENPVDQWFEDVTSCVESLDITLSDDDNLFEEAVPCCGDGIVQGSEAEEVGGCDDGNLVDGDGCSSTCRQEPGYQPDTGGSDDGGGTNDCDVCTEGDIRPVLYECASDSAVAFVQEECISCEWVEFTEYTWCDVTEVCNPDIAECEPCDPEEDPTCPIK